MPEVNEIWIHFMLDGYWIITAADEFMVTAQHTAYSNVTWNGSLDDFNQEFDFSEDLAEPLDINYNEFLE